jgi:hypothetical protein
MRLAASFGREVRRGEHENRIVHFGRIWTDDRGADQQHGQHSRQPVPQVRQVEPDQPFRAGTAGGQPVGEPVNVGSQFAVADRIDHRPRVVLRNPVEQLAQ